MMSLFFSRETKRLDSESRAALPGSFVKLKNGVTHYELSGSEDEQTIVFVHGFSVPSYIWDPTFSALVEAGFRVLRYDLFGRGTSDRPNTSYGLDLYDDQLVDLLDALKIEKQVDLIGLSMGGPIVINFCNRHPIKVRSLVLIDPVGGKSTKFSLLSLLGVLPVAGELIFGWLGNRMLLKGTAKDFYKPQNIKNFLHRYQEQMKYQGFKRSLIRTMRAGMLGDFSSIYKLVGGQRYPKLLIWGRNDHTIPISHSRIILDLMPDTEFHVVEHAGHLPHYECPEIVNPLLIKFLKK
ncbi:MAG: alpha/beta hydrolase [Chloroflexota bacterium]